MPNWCVGTLKVRGDQEKIRRFLTGAFSPIDSGRAIASFLGGEVGPEQTIEFSEDEWEMTLKTKEGFHINGTRRNFIDSTVISWYFEDEILLLHDFQAAWGVDVQALAELSKQYEVDMKIYAFERGMEFNSDIEIHKGEVVKCDEITFDDYQWECIFPELGG